MKNLNYSHLVYLQVLVYFCLSIKHRLQILGLKMVLTGIFLKMAVLLKINGYKMLALGITSMVLVKCRQAGSKTAIPGTH